MTLGKKIREARKQAGLSQEQLAEKMGVSRSAVAKWETDKGLPDVENLKILARLLGVSVDYLLDDGEMLDESIIRETYDISKFGKGIRKTKKDRVMLEKFPDARIYTLIGHIKPTKSEKIIDNLLGFFTDAPFGTPQLIHDMRNLDREFYLVEKDGAQYFVTVTDEFVETRRLVTPVFTDKFEMGNWEFVKCKFSPKKK